MTNLGVILISEAADGNLISIRTRGTAALRQFIETLKPLAQIEGYELNLGSLFELDDEIVSFVLESCGHKDIGRHTSRLVLSSAGSRKNAVRWRDTCDAWEEVVLCCESLCNRGAGHQVIAGDVVHEAEVEIS